jgi:hypothetical protein
MAKRANSGKCVHCLRNVENLTRDHVFPKAWYPDNTPQNLERWTIPSCRTCNEDYGRLEEDLLFRLGMCLDPEDAKSGDITDKVFSSIDPECAITLKEKQIRQKKREQIKNEIVELEKFPPRSIFPNFGLPNNASNVNHARYAILLISKAKLERLGHKIVRGITYIIDNSFIENDCEIKIFFIQDQDAKPILGTMSRFLKPYHCSPGIKVERAITGERADCGFYAIEIWGRLKIYAVVMPRKISA